jgi:hypothetical protein
MSDYEFTAAVPVPTPPKCGPSWHEVGLWIVLVLALPVMWFAGAASVKPDVAAAELKGRLDGQTTCDARLAALGPVAVRAAENASAAAKDAAATTREAASATKDAAAAVKQATGAMR